MMNMSVEDILGIGWDKLTHPDDLRPDMRHAELCLSQSSDMIGYSVDKRYVSSGGIMPVNLEVEIFNGSIYPDPMFGVLITDLMGVREVSGAKILSWKNRDGAWVSGDGLVLVA